MRHLANSHIKDMFIYHYLDKIANEREDIWLSWEMRLKCEEEWDRNGEKIKES